MENSLGKKMDKYKMEIRKHEYKKKFSETRKRLMNKHKSEINNQELKINPEIILLKYEKELENELNKEKPEKFKEILTKLSNYISLFKDLDNDVFTIFIKNSLIFENMKKIIKLDFPQKKEVIQKILFILGNIVVANYEDVEILLKKNLLDFFLDIINNEKTGMKEILWALANLSDNENFVFILFSKYDDLLLKTFEYFEPSKNSDEIKNLYAWYFSQLLKNSINSEKVIKQKILKNLSILGEDRYNFKIQKEILYGIFIYLHTKEKIKNQIIREDIKNLTKHHLSELIIYSLESEDLLISFSALKIIHLFSGYEKSISDLYYNKIIEDSLIKFLAHKKIKIRLFALSTILNYLLTDSFFIEKFLIDDFFFKFFFILQNDDSSRNIDKCLDILNSLFINHAVNVKYFDIIIDQFKIIDVFLVLLRKNNSSTVEKCLKCVFNLLDVGRKFGIGGNNAICDSIRNHQNFENLIYLELRNEKILKLKNKIVDNYFHDVKN